MKYLLVAGERSGDLHGSNLMKSLKKCDNNAHFKFIGGDIMAEAANSYPIVHFKEMAIMGFWDVFRNLHRINTFLKKCKKEIIKFRPDAVILIDFAGFNLRVAKFAVKQGIPVFYYISPKIWAWNSSRALKIKKYVSKMFVTLPFEKGFYKTFDYEVDYVGNPVVDAVGNFKPDERFPDNIKKISKPLIAVLPGSREQELAAMMPVLTEVLKNHREYMFLVAKVDSLSAHLYDPVKELAHVSVIEGKTYDILNAAQAAIVTSGTATLETALFHVPQVVCYKTDWFSYRIGKMVIKVDYISLVNLIAEEKIVEELIQEDCTPERISRELEILLTEEGNKRILAGYKKVIDILGQGSASEKAAEGMYRYLTKGS